MTVIIELHLPMPPSANKLWMPGKGMTKKGKAAAALINSPKYTAWKKTCHQILNCAIGWRGKVQDEHFHDADDLHVLMELDPAVRDLGGDVDNRIKGAMDFMQAGQIFRNDHQVEQVCLRWAKHDLDGECRLYVYRRGASFQTSRYVTITDPRRQAPASPQLTPEATA
jgi:hypothetical protein